MEKEAEAAQKRAEAEKEAQKEAEAAQKRAEAQKEAEAAQQPAEAVKPAKEAVDAKVGHEQKEAAAQTLSPSSPEARLPTSRLLQFDSQETLHSSPQSTDAAFRFLQEAAEQSERERIERMKDNKFEPEHNPYKRQKSWQWSDEDWMKWRESGSHWDRWQGDQQDWGWNRNSGSGWSNWSGADAEWEERQRFYRPNTIREVGLLQLTSSDAAR